MQSPIPSFSTLEPLRLEKVPEFIWKFEALLESVQHMDRPALLWKLPHINFTKVWIEKENDNWLD